MRKIVSFFIALTLSVGLWAQETQTVSYLYPVYKTPGNPASGIKEWQTGTVDAIEITNETKFLNDGWYVVTGDNVQTGTLTCKGKVHLILADGAKLTATGDLFDPGIQTYVDTLTIYGQSAQSGQLIANGANCAAGIGGGLRSEGRYVVINGGMVTANGGENGAGIGGGQLSSGSDIVINGGMVTAYGEKGGAGIGGGSEGTGYHITINGGTVTANGGIVIEGQTASVVLGTGSGIGGGYKGSTGDIYVAAALTVYAGGNNPPPVQIPYTYGGNIAGSLAGKRYVIVKKDEITGIKESAIADVNAAIEGVTSANIIAIATNAINAINAATSVETINAIKEQALADIAYAKALYAEGYTEGDAAGYQRGLEEGKAEALGEMGEPCTDCPAVEVTGQNDNMIKLYNPKKVTFKKE